MEHIAAQQRLKHASDDMPEMHGTPRQVVDVHMDEKVLGRHGLFVVSKESDFIPDG
ncbi:hypothetical protein [Sinorhizobium fredii]|uniref:hypothetical protein n=1 Tax=Rhizobium fredii TaxID=380 RepID=UPI0018F81852